MIGTLATGLAAWRGMRGFGAQPMDQRRIVFYAEDRSAWPHLGSILRHITEAHGRQVSYLTSSAEDPLLRQPGPRVRPFFIGDGHVRTLAYQAMQAGVLVSSMPDLDTFQVKRSRYPVHYLYVHHSMVSTHMIYRPDAFDHFDTVLCVGPHHQAEIRETERLYGLAPKTLVAHGYARLDTMLAAAPPPPPPRPDGAGLNILIAPSWGPEALLESCGEGLVEGLLEAGHQVTVRPHPMTRRHNAPLLDRLYGRFAGRPGFRHEENIAALDSLYAAHLMVSDWSGAALEFAFGLERPVLFVDVPRKVNNPEYTRLEPEPFEVFIRGEIGAVLDPARLGEAPGLARELSAAPERFVPRVRALRERWIYNVGRSAAVGGDYIVELSDSLQRGR